MHIYLFIINIYIHYEKQKSLSIRSQVKYDFFNLPDLLFYVKFAHSFCEFVEFFSGPSDFLLDVI